MPSFTIENHRFPSGQDTCHAWLYRPDSEHKRPVIIMAHGLGGGEAGRFAELCAAVQRGGLRVFGV